MAHETSSELNCRSMQRCFLSWGVHPEVICVLQHQDSHGLEIRWRDDVGQWCLVVVQPGASCPSHPLQQTSDPPSFKYVAKWWCYCVAVLDWRMHSCCVWTSGCTVFVQRPYRLGLGKMGRQATSSIMLLAGWALLLLAAPVADAQSGASAGQDSAAVCIRYARLSRPGSKRPGS